MTTTELWLLALSWTGILAIPAITMLIAQALHLVLTRRFDPVLRKPEFFERDPWTYGYFYSTGWPTSLLRTVSYMAVIVMPGRYRRRFGSALDDPRLQVGPVIRLLSFAAMAALAAGAVGLTIVLCWGGWQAWIDAFAQ